ncbi:MAG: hypothetical protein IKK89_00520 [Alistipes sp.]|nr:hypothetical protein [Alistipes sp.]
MKNLFTRLMLVAVAAMGFVACQDGFEDVTIAPEASEVVMTITADADDTRTVLDEVNKKVQWSDGDALKVIENSKNYRTTTNLVITDGKAQFTVAFPEDNTSESFTYNAFYPATAVSEDDEGKVNNAKVKVIVKDAQNPTATSFDPTTDILVSKQIVRDAQPTELSMQFARLVALGKMTLTNLPASSTISKVVFSVEGTDENNATKIAGRNYVDATTGVVSEYGYYGKTNTITLNYNEPISTRDIYFTCNPFVLVDGDKFTVEVTCNDFVYTREVTLEGRSLTFKQGNLNTFSVDMTSAIKEDNFVFPDGEYAVLAYNNGKYYALSCTNANNSTRLDSIDDVTYSGEGEFTTYNTNLKWSIEYTEGAGYTFKGANGKYIAWSSGNTAATQEEAYNLNITKDGATGRYIVTSKADATRKLQRNLSSSYFAFYTSSQCGSLCIVPITIKERLAVPEVEASADGKHITVSWGAIANAQNYTVTFNGTGEQTIDDTTITFEGEWNTSYEITVVANPVDDTKYIQSSATITVKIGPDPSSTSIVDILNRALTGVTGTSYTEWSGKTDSSTAVYAGNSAGGNESIQLRSNNSNSGIVTTASAGKVTKVVVDWNSNTASGRTLNIYGKNTAYTAATDLYDSNKQGTLLGTIVYGTSTELVIEGDYEYIGMRSNSGAMYLTEIQITWSASDDATGGETGEDSPVTITLDCTSQPFTTDLPSGSSNASMQTTTYTDNCGYSWTIASTGGYYFNSSYLMCKPTTYITMPVVENLALTSISLYCNNGASVSVKYTIVGELDDNVIGAEQTGVADKTTPLTWELTNTIVSTAYRIKTTNKNGQITKIVLTYTK